GNKPGVTKGKQWISVRRGVDLMDTPGILWPRIDDPVSQRNLAFIGSMNDEAINKDDLTAELIEMLKEKAYDLLNDRFGIEKGDDMMGVLCKTAGRMSMLRSGGEPDTDRAAEYIITAYRGGDLGRISLERP
ncbi:MAG: ribosome biogenesis GTPase YlqF, partial [Lachnospiraceae bacterium]|nr:ribosome biogenesis GTPase YlqF [Lachnospiraceae bacterium]